MNVAGRSRFAEFAFSYVNHHLKSVISRNPA